MTSPATGEFTVWGIADEGASAYGTPATVTRFTELLSETMEADLIRRQSAALRGVARNGLPATRETIIGRQAKGDTRHEVSATTFGLYFKHLLGGAAITGSGAAKTHTYSTGTVLGKSLSGQKQLRDSSNTLVKAISYNGLKIVKASFTINKDGVLEVVFTYDGRQESDGVAAASASYSDPIPFSFAEGALSIGGTPVANVTGAQVDYENPAVTDRRFLGGSGYKSEPTDSDRPNVSGSLDAEFLDAVAYDLFQAGTAVAFSLVFTSATVIPTTATPYSLTFTIPNIILTGETPKVGGPGIVTSKLPWVGRVNATPDPLMSMVYVTSDTAS